MRLLASKVHCDAPQMVITASFLGVGAPEAVLVGVVALVVFGPKGLAEVPAQTTISPAVLHDDIVARRPSSTLDGTPGAAGHTHPDRCMVLPLAQ